jgi:uncharacterized protein YceH (UPF0502 family)
VPSPASRPAGDGELADLKARVGALEESVAELRELVAALRAERGL